LPLLAAKDGLTPPTHAQRPSSVLDLATDSEQQGQLEDVLKMLKDNTRNRV